MILRGKGVAGGEGGSLVSMLRPQRATCCLCPSKNVECFLHKANKQKVQYAALCFRDYELNKAAPSAGVWDEKYRWGEGGSGIA